MAYVSLPAYRNAGDVDDSGALQRALDTGLQVYLPANQGSGANGEYLIGTDARTDQNRSASGNLRSNAYIFGDGIGQTVIRQTGGRYIFAAYGSTTDTVGNVSNVTLRDITLRGNADTTGFSEYEHLTLFAGISDFRAERVEFLGFRGDGMFLGNSVQFEERHNERLMIVNCMFDGINRQNRNGISIDDASDWTISNCTFKNMTTGGSSQIGPMPGPIDIEPERSFNRVTRGQIVQCGFLNNGGYAFNMLLRPNRHWYDQPINNVTITGCAVQGSDGAFRVFGVGIDATNPDPAQRQLVAFTNNYVYATTTPMFVSGGYGITFATNTMVSCQSSILNAGALSREIRITGNQWGDSATQTGGVIAQDGPVYDIQVTGNYFTNCGLPNGSLGVMYWLRGPDATHPDLTLLQLTDNTMECNVSPARITAVGQIAGERAGNKSQITVANNAYIGFTAIGPNNL